MKKLEVATVPYFPAISHVQTHPVATPSCSDYTTNELQGASEKPLPSPREISLRWFAAPL